MSDPPPKKPATVLAAESQQTSQNFGWLVMMLAVAALIVTAVWLSVRAAYENTKFTAMSRQVVQLLGQINTLKPDHQELLRRQNTDLVAMLRKAGVLYAGPTTGGLYSVPNPWNKPMTVQLLPGPYYRFESAMPAPACERVVDFFSAQRELGTIQIQIAPTDNGMVQPAVLNIEGLEKKAVPVACSLARKVRVVLFFKAT